MASLPSATEAFRIQSREFDGPAQVAVAARFRTCPPETFLGELEAFAPRTAPQRAALELYRGWALCDAGRDLDARARLLVALRGTAPGTAQRSLIRALLCESYLRKGQFLRAERCVRRALSEGCLEDTDRQFETGHRFMLGRIQRFLGHLSQARETFEEALELAGSSRFRLLLLNELAELHLLRGELEDSERYLRACQGGPARGDSRSQSWAVAITEVPLALAKGDVERAGRVAGRATREHYGREGERVRLLLTLLRVAVLLARGGREHRAEALLRGVLEQSEPGGRNSDCVAPSARALAELLLRRGRLDESLRMARLAVRTGRFDDRIEWLRAMRVEGECLWAQGAQADARRAFREAASLHTGMQFLAERQRLAATLERLGCGEEVGSPRVVSAARRAATAPEVARLTLACGATFVSCDRRLVESIGFAARTDLPVLIEGETGTGKELVAKLIHELGPRAAGPLVVLDCTALPESLADAELFGVRRGAYTGAVDERGGLIAHADGGMLFLDELTELPISVQAKLLRVLQDGTYRRVGEDHTRRVVVRVVAATNRGAQSQLEAGRLKADLFYRLCGHRIVLPPLRSRRHEIGVLAAEFARRLGGVELTADALAWLGAQPWPGNVRQLEMVVRLTAKAHEGQPRIDALQLAEAMGSFQHPEGGEDARASAPVERLSDTRRQGERAALELVLHQHGGVVRDAARHLGISRQALYKALRRTGLSPGTIQTTSG